MGYRLDINYFNDNQECENIYYGTKLYGYNLPLDRSLSYEFLKCIHKTDEYEQFDYGCYNEKFLNYEELILFLKLYNNDYNNYGVYRKEKDCFINDETIKDLILNKGKWKGRIFIIGWI